MIVAQGIGGLGNQLFKYATAKRFALELNTEIKFDLSFYRNKNVEHIFKLGKFNTQFEIATDQEINQVKSKIPNSILQRAFAKININNNQFNKPTHIIDYKYEPSEIINQINKDNSYYLQGWYANPVYFDDIKEILLNEFVPKSEFLSNSKNKIIIQLQNEESVAMHFRFGDYLTNSHFNKLTEMYYLSAIAKTKSDIIKPKYYIFSDDLDRAEKIAKSLSINYEIVNHGEEKDYIDLYLMSKCKHNIIANSTFSWWGAWLNSNMQKIVIAPKVWFNSPKAQANHEKSELLPDGWLKL